MDPAVEQAPLFTQSQHAEALAHFRQRGFVVLSNVLSAKELAHLHAFCDKTQRTAPLAWGLTAKRRQFHHIVAGLIYSQPLLDHPELDVYIRHRSFRLVDTILGGGARFSEFNLRESPAGFGPQKMAFHQDRVLPGRRGEDSFPDDVCAITYLDDVDEQCPCFCVVGGSGRFRTLQDAKAGLGDHYVEYSVYGPAGTCVLYDISLWHRRLDGKDRCGRRRRTLHQYFACGGWQGRRPPTPPLTNWVLIPRRLCHSDDPGERLFFSHWTTAQGEYAAEGFTAKARARHPRAAGENFRGLDSRDEQAEFLSKM